MGIGVTCRTMEETEQAAGHEREHEVHRMKMENRTLAEKFVRARNDLSELRQAHETLENNFKVHHVLKHAAALPLFMDHTVVTTSAASRARLSPLFLGPFLTSAGGPIHQACVPSRRRLSGTSCGHQSKQSGWRAS